MTVTPEGFLICHNVPISRIGTQDYLGREIGLPNKVNELVTIIRDESEVFNAESIASFESKPVTDDHPDVDVAPDNYARLLKGHTTNVRRGEGSDSDKLIADLMIFDKILIQEIQQGKREVSCGYDCMYEIDEEGNVYQTSIRGNHVAIVDHGRAGHRIRIKDEKIKKERKTNCMKKTGIITKILGLAKDADPGELAEIIETVQELQETHDNNESNTSDTQPAVPSAPAVNNSQQPQQDNAVMSNLLNTLENMNNALKGIDEKLTVLGSSHTDSEPDQLKALEDELAGEENVTKPVEEIDEDTTPEAARDTLSIAADNIAEQPVKNNDSLLEIVRSMTPIIASMVDTGERKKATDALTAAVRQLQGRKPQPAVSGYKTILETAVNNAKKQTRDAQPLDFSKQQEIYDNLNPHKAPTQKELRNN